MDYNSGPYDVTFPAGMTKVTCNVTIVNDTIHEGSEYFKLAVVNNSLPNRVNCGDRCVASVTIVDTSGEYLIVTTAFQYNRIVR